MAKSVPARRNIVRRRVIGVIGLIITLVCAPLALITIGNPLLLAATLGGLIAVAYWLGAAVVVGSLAVCIGSIVFWANLIRNPAWSLPFVVVVALLEGGLLGKGLALRWHRNAQPG